MRAVLISTYELGRQPFGLASPTAWLKDAGVDVTCMDTAVEMLDEEAIRAADLLGFYVPMHTATRIAVAHLERVRELNPDAHLCFFGLYGPANESYLRKLGVQTVLGGEFEEGLLSLVRRLSGAEPSAEPAADAPPTPDAQPEPLVSTARQEFLVPDRAGLPLLDEYARVDLGDGNQRTVGYTEASRGCKHLCRHCPIVPVYGGRFRIVQRDVVLEDVRRQVALGAEHITFGDPDFFNGPAHAIAIVQAMHEEFPDVSYDVTIKIEHLRKRSELLSALRDTGCLFVTSAVEAIDEPSLEAFQKHHTRQDFIDVVREFKRVGLHLNPTFVTFSPWTTLDSYADLLMVLADLDLVHNVAPIQYAIRLLIPAESLLLELEETQAVVGPFDEAALVYPWKHPDQRLDGLFEAVRDHVEAATSRGDDRASVFRAVWRLTRDALLEAGSDVMPAEPEISPSTAAVPALTEPWYCCAEPTEAQMAGLNRSQV